MGRRVPVKLRPDQYIDQIRDTTKRRGWKARVIRSKDIIKYIKVKKQKRERLRPLPSSLCIFVDETEVDEDKDGINDSRQIIDAQGDLDVHGESLRNDFTETQTATEEVESPLLKTKKVDVHVKKLKFPLEESVAEDVFIDEDDVSKDSSLGLFLSDSDEECSSCPQNDAISNIVENLSCIKRAVLLRSTARIEKLKFGYSKFELKHDTLNLDKYLFSKPRRILRRRRLLPFKETVVDTSKIENDNGKLKNNVVGLNEISAALDKSGEDVSEMLPDGIDQNSDVLLEEGFENNNIMLGMSSVNPLEPVAIFNHTEIDESGRVIEVGVKIDVDECNVNNLFENGKEGPKSDEVKDDVNRLEVLTALDLSTDDNERAATLYEESGVAASVADSYEVETGDAIADKLPVCEAEWFITARQARKEPVFVFKELELGIVHNAGSSPPVIRELLTPSELQFQGYLADSVVTDLEMQVLELTKIDTSEPDVIITEVDHVLDDENNECKAEKLESTKIDGTLKEGKVVESLKVEKFCQESSKADKDHESLNRKVHDFELIGCQKDEDLIERASTDDSDSDVVLLSDDETDLCSPTTDITFMYSWQVDILTQTWEEWPVPDKDIVLLLCKETGLSSDKIKDWYEKKTKQELSRFWAEL